jgi:hypothetical protein
MNKKMNFSASLKHHAFGRQSWIRVFCFHPQKTFDTGFRSHSINIHISHWLKPSTRKKEKPVWRWKTRENMSNSPSENGFFCADCSRLMFVWKGYFLSEVSESLLPLLETSCTHKPLPRFFLCIFALPYLPGKNLFSANRIFYGGKY